MADPFKVAVSGGTDFTDYARLETYLDKVLRQRAPNVVIYTGTSGGTEHLVTRYAENKGYPIKIFITDYDQYGIKARYVRNVSMIQDVDALVVFWDDLDKCTEHCLKTADLFEVPHSVAYYKPAYKGSL